MKCDELQYERLGDANKTYPASTLVIRKQFVDEAIAELKAENERLNRQLEHVKNGDCIYTCDVVENHVKEELKAKRALWLARAERALKARFIDDTSNEFYATGKHDLAQVYIKAEVDKVIADLEESHKMEVEQLLIEIAELKKACNDKNDWCLHTLKENRHHKYKRCLAMKKMCQQAQYKYSILSQFESSQISPNPKSFKRYDSKFRFYLRWRKCWLAIAEKFKEAK